MDPLLGVSQHSSSPLSTLSSNESVSNCRRDAELRLGQTGLRVESRRTRCGNGRSNYRCPGSVCRGWLDSDSLVDLFLSNSVLISLYIRSLTLNAHNATSWLALDGNAPVCAVACRQPPSSDRLAFRFNQVKPATTSGSQDCKRLSQRPAILVQGPLDPQSTLDPGAPRQGTRTTSARIPPRLVQGPQPQTRNGHCLDRL